MKKIRRKIHVIGLNSFKIEDLSLEVQELLHKVKYIAAPNNYIQAQNWLNNNQDLLDQSDQGFKEVWSILQDLMKDK